MSTYIEFDPVPIYDPDVDADTVSAALFHALPAMATGWYFYFEIYIPQASIDLYLDHITGTKIFDHRAEESSQIEVLWTADSGVAIFWVQYLNASFPNDVFTTPIIADTWLPVELAHGHAPKIGAVTASYSFTTSSAAGTMTIGHSSTSNDYHQIVLIRNIKIGTSYGASDLLKFDDTSTDLSMFNGGVFPMPPTFADALVTSVGDVTFHGPAAKSVWAFTGGSWREFSRFGTGDKALWGFAFGEWQQLMRSVETVEPYPWTAVIFKAADRSIGGNSILDDNELFFTTVSGKFYEIDIVVIYSNPTGGTAGGISLGGYESTSQMHGALNIFGTGRVTPIGGWLSTTLTDSTLRGAAGTATNKRVAILRGAHAGAGGIFRFEFCQAVSGASGTPVIVHAGSFLRYRLLN
jgi:hypothetical protein